MNCLNHNRSFNSEKVVRKNIKILMAFSFFNLLIHGSEAVKLYAEKGHYKITEV